MSGLFGTLNVGKRGLFAQQGALDVTSHNVSNSNTEGYTRQRAIMETTRPFGMPSMNCQIGPGQKGTGVQIEKIQRVRDTFMDYQVRRETSTLGQYEARDKYLSEIEGIFNEPTDTGISNLIGKFFDAWDEVSKHPESSNSRTVLAQQSQALASELNHTHSQLTKVKENAQESIKQSVYDVNSILDRLNKLNQQIMSVKISGMEPNDLMDKRDLLLDKLSNEFNIVVDRDNFDSINLSPKYIKTPDDTGSVKNPLLVRKNPNDEVMRFSYIKSIEKIKSTTSSSGTSSTGTPTTSGTGTNISTNSKIQYKITYLKNGDKDKEATFNINLSEDEYKRLDECRVVWSTSNKNDDAKDGLVVDKDGKEISSGSTVDFNNLALFELKDDEYKGEFKGFMSVQKDVDDYIEQMDKLAKAIAFSVNAVHSGRNSVGITSNSVKNGMNLVDADYMPFFVNGDVADKVYETVDGKKVLYDSKTKNSKGSTLSNLEEVLKSEKEITAGNISINKQILDDVMQIKTRSNDDKYDLESNNGIDGEKDGARALAIAQLRDTLFKIQNINKNTTRESFIKTMTGDGTNGSLVENITLGLKTIKGNINGMKTDSYFKDTVDKLGIQTQEAKRIVKNQEALLREFSQRRDSVSGVSMNEEMANIVQYQHAYQANAKIIATTDQLLDVVINGLKR